MLDLTFPQIFFIFMIYAVLGWVWEVSYVFTRDFLVKKQAKFVNIGGPKGPYAPIYGVGLVLITLSSPYIISFLETLGFQGTFMVISQIILVLIIATSLEYFTSYMLEKIFNTRWWDYTDTTFVNINGRVCMSSSLFFGIGGYLTYTYLNPELLNLYNSFSFVQLGIIFLIFYTIFSTDVAIKLAQLFKINPVVRKLNSVQKASSDTHKKIVARFRSIGKSEKDIKEIKKELGINGDEGDKTS